MLVFTRNCLLPGIRADQTPAGNLIKSQPFLGSGITCYYGQLVNIAGPTLT